MHGITQNIYSNLLVTNYRAEAVVRGGAFKNDSCQLLLSVVYACSEDEHSEVAGLLTAYRDEADILLF